MRTFTLLPVLSLLATMACAAAGTTETSSDDLTAELARIPVDINLANEGRSPIVWPEAANRLTVFSLAGGSNTYPANVGRIVGVLPSGKTAWEVLLSSEPMNAPPRLTMGPDGTIYTWIGSAEVMAIDGMTGATKWKVSVRLDSPEHLNDAIWVDPDNGNILVNTSRVSSRNKMLALRASDGTVLFEKKLKVWRVFEDGRILAEENEGEGCQKMVYLKRNGDVVKELPCPSFELLDSPQMEKNMHFASDGSLYVSQPHQALAFGPDMRQKWLADDSNHGTDFIGVSSMGTVVLNSLPSPVGLRDGEVVWKGWPDAEDFAAQHHVNAPGYDLFFAVRVESPSGMNLDMDDREICAIHSDTGKVGHCFKSKALPHVVVGDKLYALETSPGINVSKATIVVYKVRP